MKRPRPMLDADSCRIPGAWLTSADVARLLRVHPKHVYRLLRMGLPAQRVGGEWRFSAAEVERWMEQRRNPNAHRTPRASAEGGPPIATAGPALLAANGDLAVMSLLARLSGDHAPSWGLITADRARGIELLQRGEVMATGWHGTDPPLALGAERLVFMMLAERRVGFALRAGTAPPSLHRLRGQRLASRPLTAGVRLQLDLELRKHGLDPKEVHASAALLPSHGEVACSVARGEFDLGLATEAWARHVGLPFMPLYSEHYGVLLPARWLGESRLVRLCEIAQSASYRAELADRPGYDARQAGTLRFHVEPDAPCLATSAAPASQKP